MIFLERITEAVEKHRQLILDAERFIWQHPETGYKEFETTKYLEEKYRELGYELVKPDDITGFYTVIDTGREGPEILILGELDSVICPSHPESDPQTGAVHACGHNVQSAALLGIAAALKEDGMLDTLCGRIKLCAVPAEELLEIEYRSQLKAEGKIKFFGGKTEFLSRGFFDTSDIAFMVHASGAFTCRKGMIGCITKKISYKGKSAHAGGAPWDGINALYAANCGLNAVNAIRETFKEPDRIRIHPIVTHGGEIVNAIPELVTIESYVRGSTFDAIMDANKKMNRALCGAALSLGANIEIVDNPGYAPLINDQNMIDVVADAAKLTFDGSKYSFSVTDHVSTGCTDMGDISCVMPAVHPYSAGATGTTHGNNYYVTDPVAACVESAKWQLNMLFILLRNNAERAKKVIAEFKPRFESKKAYLDYINSIQCSGNRIVYGDNNTVTVNIK